MPLVRHVQVQCSCAHAKDANSYKVCMFGCQALKQLGDQVNKSSTAPPPGFVLLSEASGLLVTRDIVVEAMRASLREWMADFPTLVRRVAMNVEWR